MSNSVDFHHRPSEATQRAVSPILKGTSDPDDQQEKGREDLAPSTLTPLGQQEPHLYLPWLTAFGAFVATFSSFG